MSFGVRVVIALAAAFLLSTLVAPWGLYRLHWVAYLPFLWTLRKDTPRQNILLAFLYGTVAEALIFSWIADTITLFSNIPYLLAWAILLLFAVVFGSPYLFIFGWLHRFRARFGDLWMVALPCWVVVVEWIAMNTLLFPYNQGISQFKEPWVWQLASVTGTWGLSWLVVFFNLTLGEGIFRARERRPFPVRWVVASVSLLVFVTAFGAWRYETVEAELEAAPVRRFFQVQSDHTMQYRMSQPRTATYDFWAGRTAELDAGQADVIVWPEGASPYDLNASTAVNLMWDVVDAKQADFVVGSGTRERDPDPEVGEEGRVRIFNSVYFFEKARRALPSPLPTVGDTFADLLRGGCDLDAGHVYTAAEARALARQAEEEGATACAVTLAAAERAMTEGARVDPATLDAVARDPEAWAYLRRYSAGFDAPLVEDKYVRRGGRVWWRIREASCETGDCAFISVQCEADGCGVYPHAPHYDKMVPLPFGEYLPLAETFPWLADLIEGPGNFRAGTDPVVFDGDGVRVATPICYEGILGYVCDDFAAADMLINVTNDAWFGPTAASDLHGMLVTARAVELGLPVFRSTYSGVSFVVEPHGRMYAETELFEVVQRVVPVRVKRVPTVYGALGDWFVVGCAGLLAGLLFGVRRRDEDGVTVDR